MTDQTYAGKHLFLDLLIPVAREASKELSEALQPMGITLAQYVLLALLGEHGELRPAAIAKALGVETSTMTLTIQRSERDGLVLRHRDPNDARGILISLSDAGRKIIPTAHRAIEETEISISNRLNQPQNEGMRDALLALLRREPDPAFLKDKE